ncbi:MAG TPA: histidine phosphatase family protein [Candidatus Saccharimonadales bacterium]|nr:histidine phosphatase family protein [Candidatus Saccharimonadales bacterium]
METLLVFRHGESELNLRAHLTGEAAETAYMEGLPPNIDATAALTPEGIRHAQRLQQVLAAFTIDLCVSSPALRALQTAEIGLAGIIPREDFKEEPGLMERNRGIFYFLPDEIGTRIKQAHPEYWEEPTSTLRRRPKDGETLLEVMERVLPVVTYADQKVASGTVAFSTHAETMTAIRALVGRLTDAQLAEPLIPNPPAAIRPLRQANWNSFCQTDIYTKRNPFTGTVAPHMTHFQSVGVAPIFRTGWRELPAL